MKRCKRTKVESKSQQIKVENFFAADAKELKLKANHNVKKMLLGSCGDAKELKLKANHNMHLLVIYLFRDAKELKLKANHNVETHIYV